MASIITDKYRLENTKLFYEDIQSNNYYVFVSDLERSEAINSEVSQRNFLEKTIFGKELDSTFYAFRNNLWQQGVVYSQYDDTADTTNMNFYAVVSPNDNDTGNYIVFKCLSNNFGSPSLTPPIYIVENTNQIYRTADGYIWKYLFSITDLDYNRYLTLNYLPIPHDANNAVTSTSNIDVIEVENTNENRGYETVNGSITRVEVNGNIVIRDTVLSNVTNYYSGMYLYVINTDSIGNVYEISNYSYNNGTQEGIINISNYSVDSILVAGSTFSILPKIEVVGDGNGCLAIPVIENTRITNIIVLDSGEGYTNAFANVIDPFGFSPDIPGSTQVRATLRPIISPKGGHGSNFVRELRSRNLILYTQLTPQDNLTIPVSNQYSKIGIVKNPEFSSNTNIETFDNRIQLDVSNAEFLTVGETVSQVDGNEVTFQGVVHEISGNTIFVTDYMGPFQNVANSDISLDISRSLLSSQNSILNINNVNASPYIQRSGEVFYMIDFEPVERTSDSNEEYKILLEF